NSLFLTALMVLLYVEKNKDLPNMDLFNEIFLTKLRLWRDEILEFDRKYLKDVLFFSLINFFSFSKDIHLNLQLVSEFIFDNIKKYTDQIQDLNKVIQNLDKLTQENNKTIQDKSFLIQNLNKTIKEKDQIINSKTNQINQLQNNAQEKSTQLNQIQSKLSFQTKYGTAKTRIQNQLSYKLGQAMIVNSKSFLGYLIMPMALLSIMISHKQEQKVYQEKIKKDPSLKLPILEDYPDYKEALKLKNHLSYKLGQALIQANKTWYGGGYVKLLFEIGKLKREFKEKVNHV
ncbi:TPA: hypothetical protein SG436_001405, partial [Campylobacter coli]|nr:hypothetical protein [Campylobacter coli]